MEISAHQLSSNLKRSIQVEIWFERQEEVGSLEIDLVHHCGEEADGQFVYTLKAREITTGWRRYGAEEEYQVLKKLTKIISLKHNLFI